jgi:hypothetical protein
MQYAPAKFLLMSLKSDLSKPKKDHLASMVPLACFLDGLLSFENVEVAIVDSP